MSFHNPSKDWDRKEHKMDEADMATVDDDKEKINVVTEEHEHGDIPFSGMFCVICRDHATFIFEGDSLCFEHYDEKIKEILNERKKK